MTNSSAAVMVLDHYPTDEEVEELMYLQLDKYDADYAEATADIVRQAPDFMSTSEQDQINAHLRDGGRAYHILVVYMYETAPDPDDDDDDDDY